MTIRLARAEELSRLREVERAAGRRFAEAGMPELADAEPTTLTEFAAALQVDLLWIVEHPTDGAVGFAFAEPLSESLHLAELSVRPDHGRQGFGAALVQRVTEEAERLGFARVTLSTFSDVPWNRPFYEKLGFCTVPESEWNADLVAIRRHEAEDGLPPDQRVIMQLAVASR